MPERLFNRNIIIGIITAATVGLSMYGYLSLYPTFLQEQLGFTPTEAGFALSMFGIGALMGIPAGYLGDRFDQRWIIIAAWVGAIITAYFLFLVGQTPFQQSLLSFLMGTFASGVLFTNCTTVLQRSVRPEHVGRGAGLFILTYYVAAAFSGLLFARLVAGTGWAGAGLVQLTVLPIVGLAALVLVDPRRMLLPPKVRRQA